MVHSSKSPWLFWVTAIFFFLISFHLVGCSQKSEDPVVPEETSSSSPIKSIERELDPTPTHFPAFRDVAQSSGIDFQFYPDIVPGRLLLPEVMGGGVGWADFDLDGWQDAYYCNGALIDPKSGTRVETDRLYRNLGGKFQDVSIQAGCQDKFYGQGVAFGDFNADGFPDFFLGNYGPNQLYQNNGDGTFSLVENSPGKSSWSSSPLWLDINGDGLLDLYVLKYMDVTLSNNIKCEYNNKPGYCGPGSFQAIPDLVYINLGNGEFEEQSNQLGIVGENGNGLAIAAVDFDHDLVPEIYVANDMTANFLFTKKEGKYAEIGNEAGASLSGTGHNEASMGVAIGDYDADGFSDIYLTHYYHQKNTLYRNLGNLLFDDISHQSRASITGYESLGFGTVAIDYDANGLPDLFLANGHVLGPAQQPNEMQALFLWNNRGIFWDVSNHAGDYFQKKVLGRGVASVDFNNDLKPDVAVTHLDVPVALLQNETETPFHTLGLQFLTPSRMLPVGGRVVIKTPTGSQSIAIVGGGSYLSHSDERMLIGVGPATTVDFEIHWPDGTIELHKSIAADRYYVASPGESLAPLTTTEYE